MDPQKSETPDSPSAPIRKVLDRDLGGGRRMLRYTLKVQAHDTKAIDTAEALVMDAIDELNPENTHFIYRKTLECDAIRDGAPKGRRYRETVILWPFPRPLARGRRGHDA